MAWVAVCVWPGWSLRQGSGTSHPLQEATAHGIVHGDLHGGNIMVDSRSYAWLIDYGEVDDGHVFRDPAKLEACMCFIYTTLPIPPSALLFFLSPFQHVRRKVAADYDAAGCGWGVIDPGVCHFIRCFRAVNHIFCRIRIPAVTL